MSKNKEHQKPMENKLPEVIYLHNPKDSMNNEYCSIKTIYYDTPYVLESEHEKISADFLEWIGNKMVCDSWFTYNKNNHKWFWYGKGHLTSREVFQEYLNSIK